MIPHIDFSSATWKQIEAWAQEQLRIAHERNESLGLDMERTSAMRGEIRLLKRILGLPKEAAREAGIAPD